MTHAQMESWTERERSVEVISGGDCSIVQLSSHLPCSTCACPETHSSPLTALSLVAARSLPCIIYRISSIFTYFFLFQAFTCLHASKKTSHPNDLSSDGLFIFSVSISGCAAWVVHGARSPLLYFWFGLIFYICYFMKADDIFQL